MTRTLRTLGLAAAVAWTPLPSAADETSDPPDPAQICGYEVDSVAHLMKQLEGNADLQFSSAEGDYIQFENPKIQRLWTFTLEGRSPIPIAAVCRTITNRDGQIGLDMEILCEAPTLQCDALVSAFKQQNAALLRQIDPQ